MPLRFGIVFTPVHRQIDASRVEPFGSATLITFGDFHVLISAAHVIAEARSRPLLLPGRPEFTRISGPAIMSDLAALRAGVTDRYDLGFMFIDDLQKASLEAIALRFLPYTEIATPDDFDQATACVFSGYPVSKSETRVGARIIKSTPFFATCALLKSEDASGDLIIGEYDRENLTAGPKGVRITGPDPSGCSGGPIWTRKDQQAPKLAGIGTDYDPDKKRLRGTRLTEILPEILRRKTGKSC